MWKLSYFVLLLITIGNSSSHDQPGTTKISRNFRNHENQRYRNDGSSIEIMDKEADARDSEDYLPIDSEEFAGEEVIGKWRNSGLALEPKWRDGDSLPLVPFEGAASRKKFTRHEDSSKLLESTRVSAKFVNPDDPSSRIHVSEELTIEKIPSSFKHREEPLFSEETNDRYSLEENFDGGRKRPDDDSPPRNNVFSRGEKFSKIPTTNSMFYEATEELKNPGDQNSIGKGRNGESTNDPQDSSSRTSYRDAFRNDYELNDEEYQKPRPRKRRPPQNDEFVETRRPSYSISWSTERYTESKRNLDRSSTRTTRKPEVGMGNRRGSSDDKNRENRARDKSTNTRRGTENSELRNLLKMQQTEGLSLSELLQRRNFTLNDLLGGKAEVLDVLKSSDNDSAEITNVRSKIFELEKLDKDGERSRWRPSDSLGRKSTNTSFNEITKILRNENDIGANNATKKDENEDTREKTDSFESETVGESSNENEKLSAIVRLTKPIILPRLNFFTDQTTSMIERNEKIASALSEGNRSEENSGKPVESKRKLEEDEIMEFSDFTMKKIESATVFPEETTDNRYEINVNDDSGSTLSIENILSTTQRTFGASIFNESKIFEANDNAVTTNENNSGVLRVLDYPSDEPRETTNNENPHEKRFSTNDEELTMSDEPCDKTTIKISQVSRASENETPIKRVIFSTSSRPYELVISEIEPEARAEIFELFSTGSSAKRLERLLESRNMSIDELIELRKRGSSKVHLAEISEPRARVDSENREEESSIKPWKSAVRARTKFEETTSEDLSDVEIDSASMDTREDEESEEQTNISSVGTEPPKLEATTRKNDVENDKFFDLLRVFDSLPFSIGPETIGDERELRETEISVVRERNSHQSPKERDDSTNRVEIGIVEEVIEQDSTTIKETTETDISTNYSSVGNDKEEKKKLSKLRPSIIASGAILGLTAVVFLAIFIVFRIRQKQKYTYSNSFSRSVFQGPVMAARKLSNSSSLNTIMVNVVATSTTKRPERREIEENFQPRNEIEHDSLDANDSWETIPDFMK